MPNNFATQKQKIQLHTLLSKYGQLRGEDVGAGEKVELVRQFSNGRVTSTTGLRQEEAAKFIRSLQAKINTDTPEGRMRRSIIAMAHEMRWQFNTGEADMNRINAWCVRLGQFHKPLNAHNSEELQALVSQFRKVYQSYLKAIMKS